MAVKSVRRKKSLTSPWSNAQIPLRIVPLHAAPRAAATGTPQLSYRGGRLLSAVEVFTIFWGKGRQQSANANLMKQMNTFFDFVLTSKLMDQLTEYDAGGVKIGHGKRTGTVNLEASEGVGLVTDSEIQTMLQAQISGGVACGDEKFPVLRFYATRIKDDARRRDVVRGFLRISRRDERWNLLCCAAVPGIQRLRRRIDND